MIALYKFRPFNPIDEEYERINTVYNVGHPDDPSDVAMVKYYDSQRDLTHLFTRHVCLYEDKIVGMCNASKTFWMSSPEQFMFWWQLLPEHEEAATVPMLNQLKAVVAPHNPQSYFSTAKENQVIRRAALEGDGFDMVQRNARSALNVPAFDTAACDGLFDKINTAGITLIDHTELVARNSNWLTDFADAKWEIIQDMPSSEPLARPPLSHFEKQFDAPDFDPKACLFALDGDKIVGMSNVLVNPNTAEKLQTRFTGVKRPYRRKGVATALKVRIIQFAQAYGAKIIEAGNEESNPMYALNVRLGFRPIPANLEYKKQL